MNTENRQSFSREQTLTIGILVEGGLLAFALILGLIFNVRILSRVTWTWASFVWGILGSLVLLGGLALIQRVPWKPIIDLNQTVERLVEMVFRRSTLLDLAVISLLAGLGEEALFRGFLQPLMAERMVLWVAILLTSVIFGLAHFITPAYVVFAFGVSIYLGWLASFSENLLVPAITHGMYDFLALLYFKWRKRAASEEPVDQSEGLQ